MLDSVNSLRQTFHPEAAIAFAQKGAACWSRAYTQMFDGLMSAAKAQSDLARTMFAMDHSEWPNLMTPGTANDAARRWLTGNVEKLDAVRLKYRQMDDSLTASFLAAAESLIDGLIPESPHLSDATKTTIPVEKKSATTAKEKVAAQ